MPFASFTFSFRETLCHNFCLRFFSSFVCVHVSVSRSLAVASFYSLFSVLFNIETEMSNNNNIYSEKKCVKRNDIRKQCKPTICTSVSVCASAFFSFLFQHLKPTIRTRLASRTTKMNRLPPLQRHNPNQNIVMPFAVVVLFKLNKNNNRKKKIKIKLHNFFFFFLLFI